ncbi:MAG: hypothetical protein ACYDH5_14330 [Acidimicrobiales bacterium]
MTAPTPPSDASLPPSAPPPSAPPAAAALRAPGATRPGPVPAAGDGLAAPARALLTSAGLSASAMALSQVFTTLFFYVTSGSIVGMAMWSAGRYVGLMVTSVAVTVLLPRMSPKKLFRAGLVSSAAFYALLIALGSSAGGLAMPLGLVDGAAMGIYWFGNNTLVYDVVRPRERGRYYGTSFAIQSLVNVVMPLAAGGIVAGLGGRAGYMAVFALALATFAGAAWSGRRLADAPGVGSDASLVEVVKLPFQSRGWGRMWLAVSMRGFKQTAGGLGLIALVWLASASAAAQGEYAALTAMAGVVTSVLAGRARGHWRSLAMWTGAGGFALATVLLAPRPELPLLLTYGAVTGLIYPGLMVPVSAVVLEVMDEDPEAGERRGDYVLSRELAANSGRLAAIALLVALLAVAPAHVAMLVLVSTAAAMQLVVARLGSSARQPASGRRLAAT